VDTGNQNPNPPTSFNFLLSFASSSGDSEVARIVVDESTAAGEEAKKFLEDVRVTFPQVVVTMFFCHLSQIIMDSLASQNLCKFVQLEFFSAKVEDKNTFPELKWE
jgi:hypothetical protein